MDIKKIEETKEKLINRHYRSLGMVPPSNLVSFSLEREVTIVLSQPKKSPWKLLLEIFVFILTEYHNGTKWSFKLWQVLKHIKAIKKIIQFFKNI